MVTPVLQKYEDLKGMIRSYERAGVAFSGGIDSSLLLHAAGEVLGKDNVLALHGRSVLNRSVDVERIFTTDFQDIATLEVIELNPLSWPDFINNDHARCYHCKKKTYTLFQKRLAQEGISILLDGTNADDHRQQRPGYAVLEELQVYAPLEQAGIGKKEIRFLAKFFGISHYNLPSNSCLATRLAYLPRICGSDLHRVKRIEDQLEDLGFTGCRARPVEKGLLLEVRQQDFQRISRTHNRIAITNLCRSEGFADVFLNLRGR